MLWPILNKSELFYYSLLCINVVSIYGGSPTAMNAVLAIIADGRRAIVVIYREEEEIN